MKDLRKSPQQSNKFNNIHFDKNSDIQLQISSKPAGDYLSLNIKNHEFVKEKPDNSAKPRLISQLAAYRDDNLLD